MVRTAVLSFNIRLSHCQTQNSELLALKAASIINIISSWYSCQSRHNVLTVTSQLASQSLGLHGAQSPRMLRTLPATESTLAAQGSGRVQLLRCENEEVGITCQKTQPEKPRDRPKQKIFRLAIEAAGR